MHPTTAARCEALAFPARLPSACPTTQALTGSCRKEKTKNSINQICYCLSGPIKCVWNVGYMLYLTLQCLHQLCSSIAIQLFITDTAINLPVAHLTNQISSSLLLIRPVAPLNPVKSADNGCFNKPLLSVSRMNVWPDGLIMEPFLLLRPPRATQPVTVPLNK